MKLRYLFAMFVTPYLLAAVADEDLSINSANNQQCLASKIEVVRKHLKIKRNILKNGQIIAACKNSGSNRNIEIVSFVFPIKKDYAGFVVAILDKKNNKVVASVYSDAWPDEENFSASNLRIDTANYAISDNLRAFGIDITWHYGSGCGDGFPGPDRMLFIQNGAKIEQVSDKISLSQDWQLEGGVGGRCSMEHGFMTMLYSTTVIAVEETQTKGLNDLKLTARAKIAREVVEGNDKLPSVDCDAGKFSMVIKYDGARYPTKKWDEAFGKWLHKKSEDKSCLSKP